MLDNYPDNIRNFDDGPRSPLVEGAKGYCESCGRSIPIGKAIVARSGYLCPHCDNEELNYEKG